MFTRPVDQPSHWSPFLIYSPPICFLGGGDVYKGSSVGGHAYNDGFIGANGGVGGAIDDISFFLFHAKNAGGIPIFPRLIGYPSHWSPVSLVTRLIGHPSHWSPISLDTRLIGSPF